MLKGKETCITDLMKHGNQGGVGGFSDALMLGLTLRSEGRKSFTLGKRVGRTF